jgi:BTB/POZ domain
MMLLVARKDEGKQLSCPASYHWKLQIYVRGHSSSSTDREEYLSIYLVLTDPDVTVKADYVIKAASKTKTALYTFSNPTTGAFGWFNFIARDELLNTAVPSALLQQDGSLTIEVDLRVYQNKPVWYPTPPSEDSAKTLWADLVRSSFSPTVTFKVGELAFTLHSHVLAKRAPALLDMIDGPTDQTVPLSDEDVDAGIFQSIVLYMYTGDWSPSSSSDGTVDAVLAKNTLTLADCYGCTGLKLLVESVMVDKVLNTSNAAEMLLLGDSLHCALLKEAAIKEILANIDAVRSLPGWELLKESNSLLEELLLMSTIGMKSSNETAATATLSVGELRDQLLSHGAAVDGSREVLVQRLLAVTTTTETAAAAVVA